MKAPCCVGAAVGWMFCYMMLLICGGGVSLSVRGRQKRWVTFRQQLPGRKPPEWRGWGSCMQRIAPSPLITLLLSAVTHSTPRRYPCPQTAKWNLTSQESTRSTPPPGIITVLATAATNEEKHEEADCHNYSQMPPVARNRRDDDRSYLSRPLLWGSAAHFI